VSSDKATSWLPDEIATVSGEGGIARNDNTKANRAFVIRLAQFDLQLFDLLTEGVTIDP
jgi:hypothetical protein